MKSLRTGTTLPVVKPLSEETAQDSPLTDEYAIQSFQDHQLRNEDDDHYTPTYLTRKLISRKGYSMVCLNMDHMSNYDHTSTDLLK